ncbi:MAG: class I SAM-dependent methyltransferase [Nanoarchaeota archaeon]
MNLENETLSMINQFFPAYIQLENLGINQTSLKDLKKYRLNYLDIGCGNGDLVNFFLEQGIKAEGIDTNAPKGFNFIKLNIGDYKNESKGKIPRKDQYYDLITAHSIHPFLKFSLGLTKDEGIFIVKEALRVLNFGGMFMAYPGLYKIEENIKNESFRIEHHISGLGLRRSDEDILKIFSKLRELGINNENILKTMKYKTLIFKHY